MEMKNSYFVIVSIVSLMAATIILSFKEYNTKEREAQLEHTLCVEALVENRLYSFNNCEVKGKNQRYSFK